MKILIKPILSLFCCGFILGCTDKETPLPINQEEVITTMTITLTPAVGPAIILQARDLDVDGPNPPVITVSSNFAVNTLYLGSAEFLDESGSPADDITLEIKSEDEEHQLFYQVGAGVDMSVTYNDQDSNGQPLGLDFDLQTGTASSGTLTVSLIHLPDKDGQGVADGDITNAGGETDAMQTFNVTIQ